MSAKTFGQFFKDKRRELGLSLREFCRENSLDSGNISKLERDIFGAPKETEKLEDFANALHLKKGTAEYESFLDLAKVSNKDYGISVISNPNLLEKLPLLFRTINDKDFSEEELDGLIQTIRDAKAKA